VVDAEGREDARGAEPDAARVARDRGEDQLRRRAPAELGRSVVLDRPPAAVAELVAWARLLDRLLVELAGVGLVRGLRGLELGEDVQEHRRGFLGASGRPPGWGTADPADLPVWARGPSSVLPGGRSHRRAAGGSAGHSRAPPAVVCIRAPSPGGGGLTLGFRFGGP